MPKEIEIYKDGWETIIEYEDFLSLDAIPDLYCEYCGNRLDAIYTYIISCLKESNLLPDNFKLLCCVCDTLKEYPELLHLHLHTTFHISYMFYSSLKDILTLTFSKGEFHIYIRIHDWSKIK